MKPRIELIIMKIFIKNSENLSKVTPNYGTHKTWKYLFAKILCIHSHAL